MYITDKVSTFISFWDYPSVFLIKLLLQQYLIRKLHPLIITALLSVE